MSKKYYIVRKKTNIRATTRSKDPTIVEGEERAQRVALGYEAVVRPKVGKLVPIRVEDFHEKYGNGAVPKGKAMEE